MKYYPIFKIVFISSTLLFIASCGDKKLSPSQGGYKYKGVYFGSHFTKHYKEGIRDGCDTARGLYKKGHWLFKNSNDYNNGWFFGRNKCRKLLEINKSGDLIL